MKYYICTIQRKINNGDNRQHVTLPENLAIQNKCIKLKDRYSDKVIRGWKVVEVYEAFEDIDYEENK